MSQSRQHNTSKKFPIHHHKVIIISEQKKLPTCISFIGGQFDKHVWWRIWNSLYHYSCCLVQLYTMQMMLVPHSIRTIWSQLAPQSNFVEFFFLKKKKEIKKMKGIPIESSKSWSTILFYLFYIFALPPDNQKKSAAAF